MDSPQTNPDLKPSVDVHKRTTKVNLAVIIGVVVFLALTVFVIIYIARAPQETVEEQHRKAESPNP